MTVHIPILVRPIVEALLEPLRRLSADDSRSYWVVDCTFGGGGHSGEILAALSAEPGLARHRVLAIDQDQDAVTRGKIRFEKQIAAGQLEIHQAPFSEIAAVVGERLVMSILADLGFSSDQIEAPERGLSFQLEGPLDMRMNPAQGASAREFLQKITEKELMNLIRELGEEKFAGRIASAIVRSRREGGLPATTRDLAELIFRSVPPNARHGRIHPATRTFQALRIAVNRELEELDSLLAAAPAVLQPGGRIAILSFHSLEDRRVKQAFRTDPLKPVTKKPLEADEAEISANPRARSAKLRVAER